MLLLICLLLSLYMALVFDLLSFSLRRVGWSGFSSTFLLFYSQIICSEFLLGLVSALNSLNLALLNLTFTSCLLAAIWHFAGKSTIRKYLLKRRNLVPTLWRAVRTDRLWLVLFALAFLFGCWILFLGILFPAIDYDGNSYHLTFIGQLIQNHNFFDVPTSLPWLTGYPKGGEFIQAWSVIIARNDALSDLSQVPFLVLGIYALYELAVTIGADKKQARFAALLFAFLPIVLNQLKTTYIDVMLCATFFASLALVARKNRARLDWLLIGITFSLLISFKSTGVLFVAILAPLLLWNLYRTYQRQLVRYLQPLLLVVAPMAFGLYWYLKNYLLYGSPLYPFGITVAGHTIFPGQSFADFAANAIKSTSLPNGCVQRIWFVWTEQKDWFGCFYNYDTNYTGLGPIWFIILIPAFLLSLYVAYKKRNALYIAVTATIVGLFAIYPNNYYSRYTMFVTAAGILALSLVLSVTARLTVTATKVTTIILAMSVLATNFTLCNYSPVVVASQLKSVLAGSARGSAYANIPGPAFVFLEARLKPGNVVAYDSSPYFIYPLWTPDFSDTVLYLPARDQSSWYRQLGAKHVDYVFTSIGSRENGWAKNQLREIYKDQMYEIFQIN